MYIFNRVTVVPQLPKRIGKLSEMANNLWWSWNTEFLKLFKTMDRDLWEVSEKNPVKFLKMISQERIERDAGSGRRGSNRRTCFRKCPASDKNSRPEPTGSLQRGSLPCAG